MISNTYYVKEDVKTDNKAAAMHISPLYADTLGPFPKSSRKTGGFAKGIMEIAKPMLGYGGAALAGTYGTGRFILPEIQKSTGKAWQEVRDGTGILAKETQQRLLDEVSKLTDTTADASQKAMAAVGDGLNKAIEAGEWSWKEFLAQTILGGGATAGYLAAAKALHNKQLQRRREAERYRNREYQRLHYDSARGNVPPDTFSNKEEEIDKTVNNKERTQLTDFTIPAALLAAGAGAGWLGYKQFKPPTKTADSDVQHAAKRNSKAASIPVSPLYAETLGPFPKRSWRILFFT